MAEISQEQLTQAAQALQSAGAREVYLFGSAASGALKAVSDVDLAVAGLPPERFFGVMTQVRRILGRSLDLVDLDEPSPFVRHLRESGNLRRVL